MLEIISFKENQRSRFGENIEKQKSTFSKMVLYIG